MDARLAEWQRLANEAARQFDEKMGPRATREELKALGWSDESLDVMERLGRGEHLNDDFLRHAARA